MKKLLNPETSMGAVPVVMVSCGDEKESNITTIAWTGILNSEPPLVYVSIRPTRKSYHIIKEKKEFVMNIPDENLVWETDFCGTKSGKEIDKFKEANLTKEKCENVSAPAIKECPIQLECKLVEIKHLGSHDMFIAEIVGIRCEEKYLDEKGKIDYTKTNLLTYGGQSYFSQNKEVGKRGICLNTSNEK